MALLLGTTWLSRGGCGAIPRCGWLWFLGTLVPTLGLVQAGSQARADRYSYVPQVGLALACVGGRGASAS
jgi:hypothetical protein